MAKPNDYIVGVDEPPPQVETFTAADLMQMNLPEPRWAVPGVLPEGLSILAGKPKLGKSWMLLGLALAVAMGGVALGGIEVEQGDVLYLALEDTKRRLQNRLNKPLRCQNAAPPKRLTLTTECPRQNERGLDWLKVWLATHPQARLVIIDTLGRFKPKQLTRGDSYDQEYADGAELKAVAGKEGLCMEVSHHCRKASALDPLDEVRGSVALSGVADGILVLRRERGQLDASLQITGRDVEEQELALKWEPEYCQWNILGNADEHRMSKERTDVLDLLRREGQPLTPTQVARGLGKKVSGVKSMMFRMADEGKLQSLGSGKYWILSNQRDLGICSNGRVHGNDSNPSNPSNPFRD
jgi:hypothetical protein